MGEGTAAAAARGRKTDIGFLPGKTARNNVISYMEEHVRNHPDRVALRWVEQQELGRWDGRLETPLPHREITFGQFERLIMATARGLAALGVREGDRVIIFLPMGLGMYTAMFAVQTLGAIATFLDSWARAGHLGASAECVRPKAMISFARAFELIEGVAGFESLELRIIAGPTEGGRYDARLEELMAGEGRVEVCPVESEHTALITFTTGSSGKPKGANRTHRFLSAQHLALDRVIPYRPHDIDMPAFPIFSLNNLAAGVTTVIPAVDLARPSERDPIALANQIRHGAITCTTLSPSMLNGVSRFCLERGVQLASLRRVVTGGAPISKDNVRDFAAIAPRAEIWVLYGSTEVEPMAHIEAKEMLAVPGDPDPEVVEEGVNVGHISEDLDYKFLRIVRGPIDLGRTPWEELEVPRGEVGEFVVSGDHVCRDYYNNEEAFRQTKIREADGRIWHRTGDLARQDERGYLWVVGRVHNAIERGGRYYFPVRAEVILKRLPFVRQGAFLGMPDERLGERTAVAVVLDRAQASPEQALAEIRRLFAKNAIPLDAFYVVDEIPMDPRHHSKVEYRVLRERLLAGQVPDLLADPPG
ncbi:MAG: peptide synthase [Planctomycetota bacterium]|nr:MAG: peptide synthase [Planctomycetota bacterium]